VCSLVNSILLVDLKDIWEVTTVNGKYYYVCDVVNLKIPHHPFFHIFKTFIDVLNEFSASEPEIER
jgi:hypothetical protein